VSRRILRGTWRVIGGAVALVSLLSTFTSLPEQMGTWAGWLRAAGSESIRLALVLVAFVLIAAVFVLEVIDRRSRVIQPAALSAPPATAPQQGQLAAMQRKLNEIRSNEPLEFVFDRQSNAFAQQNWAEGPHRLFGWWYRIGVKNAHPTRSVDGVRLLLANVPEQPFRPIYLKLSDDAPPYERSREGVRLDPGAVALFDVVFFNHENPREEIQFFYASTDAPNLRPPGHYTLELEAQARDVPPRKARWITYVADEDHELKFEKKGRS
jgi:hypothetical protein